MENTSRFNPDPVTITRSAFIIDKIHQCDDCPIRKMAIKQPRSIFARIHAWHASWWPGWSAHQARTCAYRAMAQS